MNWQDYNKYHNIINKRFLCNNKLLRNIVFFKIYFIVWIMYTDLIIINVSSSSIKHSDRNLLILMLPVKLFIVTKMWQANIKLPTK